MNTKHIPPTPLQRGSKENPPLREVTASGGRRMFGLVLISLFVIIPLFSHAAPIVPCGIDDAVARGLSVSYAEPCDFHHFIIGINNIINFLIMIGGSIAAIVFAIAGFMILTAGGNESKMEKGRGMFMQVVWGFIWMLSAWLIVKMVLVGLGVPAGFSFLGT